MKSGAAFVLSLSLFFYGAIADSSLNLNALRPQRRRLSTCSWSDDGGQGCTCGDFCCIEAVSSATGTCMDIYEQACTNEYKVVDNFDSGAECSRSVTLDGPSCKGWCDVPQGKENGVCRDYTPVGEKCESGTECRGGCDTDTNTCFDVVEEICGFFDKVGTALLAVVFGVPAVLLLAVVWCCCCRKSTVSPSN